MGDGKWLQPQPMAHHSKPDLHTISISRFTRVGVRIAQVCQNLAFSRLHSLGLALILVIVTLQVQDAMHHQMCVMCFERLVLCQGLRGYDRRTKHHIAGQPRALRRAESARFVVPKVSTLVA